MGLGLLFGTGLLLTVRTGGFQLRRWGYWMRHTLGAIPVSYTHLDVYKRQAFTTVSDQAGRTFQVPVNGGFSESYETLYVPHGTSEQAN